MKKIDDDTVSVVHLIWIPFGPVLFEKFISSYCKYNSGYSHELVLLFNGVSAEHETDAYLQIVDAKKISYRKLVHFGECQDLDAYWWAASQLESEYLLFLNSYSQLLHDGWLAKFVRSVSKPGVGLVGATGSWQSYYRTVFVNNRFNWDATRSFNENIRKFRLMIKAFAYWRFLFPDFPNPHIRTNAFMIKRELMLSLDWPRLTNKLSAYKLESGFNGITAQIKKRQMMPLVIDKNGNEYRQEEWPSSKIFWNDDQQNLLVSDNQTQRFSASNAETRSWLSTLAWGNYREH